MYKRQHTHGLRGDSTDLEVTAPWAIFFFFWGGGGGHVNNKGAENLCCVFYSLEHIKTLRDFVDYFGHVLLFMSCADPGIFSGGSRPDSQKTVWTTFFYFSTDFTVYKEGGPMVLLQRKLYITCDFSGGSRPHIAPLDLHMSVIQSCLFRAGLWSPAGKGLLYVIILSLSHMVSWVRYGIWLYQFLILAIFLIFVPF